jgi:hypothetical protein
VNPNSKAREFDSYGIEIDTVNATACYLSAQELRVLNFDVTARGAHCLKGGLTQPSQFLGYVRQRVPRYVG